MLQKAIFPAEETSEKVKVSGRKHAITKTDTKMRYNEGRSKGEKHAQFLQYFRFTLCYFRTSLQATFVMVNEVIPFAT
jgi:hypothetical protein